MIDFNGMSNRLGIFFHYIDLFDTWDPNTLQLRFRVNPKVVAMKGYSILPRALELEPHHQIHFSIESKPLTLWRGMGSYNRANIQVVFR